LKLITNYEGCRLSPYKCPAGIWTNGIGHTGGVDPNRVITLEEVAYNLVSDVKEAERCVNKFHNGSLNQGKFDSMVSFTMNVGCTKFKGSTFSKTGECSELLRWVYVKDPATGKMVKSKGISNRRDKEYALCVK